MLLGRVPKVLLLLLLLLLAARCCSLLVLAYNRYADGPRYYSDPRLMSYNVTPFSHPDITSHLVSSPGYSDAQLLQLHLVSLKHQLSQFYAAAALAVVLGRTLVLPQFSCYCYRDPDSGPQGPSSRSAAGDGWSCRAPGDDVSTMPFACTLEQV
jgi:hypothetical protein